MTKINIGDVRREDMNKVYELIKELVIYGKVEKKLTL